jgi:8-oxo-dGTP pyrophosphatase MutT (NUDIX family)
LQPEKPMYNLWQVVCGKVEKGESSLQAVLRETEEETELEIGRDNTQLIFNDPTFNSMCILLK